MFNISNVGVDIAQVRSQGRDLDWGVICLEVATKANGMPLALTALIFIIEYLQYHPHIWPLKYMDHTTDNTQNMYN